MFDHIQRPQRPPGPQDGQTGNDFLKTGYTRIPRVVSITGAYKCRNNETQSFESASSEYLKKNQLLLELKEKYMSVAEMAGNSARTIEKHYYKNTKQEELRQRMNARYGGWGQQAI